MSTANGRDRVDDDLVIDVKGSTERSRFGMRPALLGVTALALVGGVVLLATQSGSDRADLQSRGEGTVVDSASAFTSIDAETVLPVDTTESTTTSMAADDTQLPDVTIPTPSGETPTDDTPTSAPTTTVFCDWSHARLTPPTTTQECTRPPTAAGDIYREICVPLQWTTCAEYRIFDELGIEQARVIGPGDWTLAEIAAAGGGGQNGSAVKIRDIYPA